MQEIARYFQVTPKGGFLLPRRRSFRNKALQVFFGTESRWWFCNTLSNILQNQGRFPHRKQGRGPKPRDKPLNDCSPLNWSWSKSKAAQEKTHHSRRITLHSLQIYWHAKRRAVKYREKENCALFCEKRGWQTMPLNSILTTDRQTDRQTDRVKSACFCAVRISL